jgi:hypothetical protein
MRRSFIIPALGDIRHGPENIPACRQKHRTSQSTIFMCAADKCTIITRPGIVFLSLYINIRARARTPTHAERCARRESSLFLVLVCNLIFFFTLSTPGPVRETRLQVSEKGNGNNLWHDPVGDPSSGCVTCV